MYDLFTSVYKVNTEAYDMLNLTHMDFIRSFQLSLTNVHKIRTKRAWFDLIGRGMQVAFGVATSKDVQNIYTTIEEVRRTQAEGFQKVAEVTAQFASFMKITASSFESVSNKMLEFSELLQQLLTQQTSGRQLMVAVQQYIPRVLRQAMDFSLKLNHLTQFRLSF